jgi:hypothetical protein
VVAGEGDPAEVMAEAKTVGDLILARLGVS